ncbi:MAG: acyl carrier protein, partial [Flavobacteriaceae bacterium]
GYCGIILTNFVRAYKKVILVEKHSKIITYLVKEFEKEFDIQIPDDQAENIATVGQAITYIEGSK